MNSTAWFALGAIIGLFIGAGIAYSILMRHYRLFIVQCKVDVASYKSLVHDYADFINRYIEVTETPLADHLPKPPKESTDV